MWGGPPAQSSAAGRSLVRCAGLAPAAMLRSDQLILLARASTNPATADSAREMASAAYGVRSRRPSWLLGPYFIVARFHATIPSRIRNSARAIDGGSKPGAGRG